MPISTSTFRHVTTSPFPRRNLRVPGEGPQPCRCILIGEKPGRDESHRGKPFVGLSGKYLDLCLNAAAIDRSTLFITNCVMEFTEYSKPAQWELERDKPALIQEILACDPEIIGLLGGWSVEWVLGREKAELEKTHGCPFYATDLLGGAVGGRRVVLPMLHPAGAIYSPEALPQILDDVLTLGKLLDNEIVVQERLDSLAGTEDYRVITAVELGTVLSK